MREPTCESMCVGMRKTVCVCLRWQVLVRELVCVSVCGGMRDRNMCVGMRDTVCAVLCFEGCCWACTHTYTLPLTDLLVVDDGDAGVSTP